MPIDSASDRRQHKYTCSHIRLRRPPGREPLEVRALFHSLFTFFFIIRVIRRFIRILVSSTRKGFAKTYLDNYSIGRNVPLDRDLL